MDTFLKGQATLKKLWYNLHDVCTDQILIVGIAFPKC